MRRHSVHAGSNPADGSIERFNMSEEFIQYHFPCGECLVQAACKDHKRIREEVKKIMNDVPSLGVPKFEKDKSYHKGLLECLMNIQQQILNQVSRSENPDNNEQQVVDKLPMKYVHIMISMADILCHMVNTTSWREGELFDFDRVEIKKRLTQLKGWL